MPRRYLAANWPPERSPSPSRISVAGGDTTQYGTAARARNQVRSRPPRVRGARHLPVRRVRAHRGRRVLRSSEGRLRPARAVGAQPGGSLPERRRGTAHATPEHAGGRQGVGARHRDSRSERSAAERACPPPRARCPAGSSGRHMRRRRGALGPDGLHRGEEPTPRRSSALVSKRLMSLPDVLASCPISGTAIPISLGVAAPSALSARWPRP